MTLHSSKTTSERDKKITEALIAPGLASSYQYNFIHPNCNSVRSCCVYFIAVLIGYLFCTDYHTNLFTKIFVEAK